MSNVSSWLRGQRKTELTELASAAGLKNYEQLKKSDLEVALDEYLREHETSLSKHSKFNPFYTRANSSGSPVKRESVPAAVTSDSEKPAKPRGRRVTKVADEISAATDESSPDPSGRSTTLTTRTPRANLSVARNVPLPPSPAAVADAIDRRTAALRTKVGDAWDKSGVVDKAESLRESLSSVASIEALVFAVEAFGIRGEVLPLRYAFTFPAIALLRTSELNVYLPDLFFLLTATFWSPVSLWVTTSVGIPLLFAYFFNLTLKSRPGHSALRSHSGKPTHKFDPLTFNVVKALVAFLIYSQDVTFGGLVSIDSVERVRDAIPGGSAGILIGAGIGALVSFYEAILKK